MAELRWLPSCVVPNPLEIGGSRGQHQEDLDDVCQSVPGSGDPFLIDSDFGNLIPIQVQIEDMMRNRDENGTEKGREHDGRGAPVNGVRGTIVVRRRDTSHILFLLDSSYVEMHERVHR
jgi:hypothetical protein